LVETFQSLKIAVTIFKFCQGACSQHFAKQGIQTMDFRKGASRFHPPSFFLDFSASSSAENSGGYAVLPDSVLEVKPVEYGAGYQHSAPAVVQVQVHQVAPVPMEGGFVAHVVSNRHHKFVTCCNMEPSFSQEPTRWVFHPSPVPGAFLVSAQWVPAPAAVPLQLVRAPTPLFWRAVRQADWEVRFGSQPATEEYLWRLEQTVGGCAFRNVASGLLLSADHGLRANRQVAQQWESFAVTALSAEVLAAPHAVPVVDPLCTQAVNARVRIRSVRYGRLLGLKRRHRVCWSHRDTLWDLLASPDGEGYLIRNSAHPDVRVCLFSFCSSHVSRKVYWRADGAGRVEGGAAHSVFAVERAGEHYAFRCAATGRICTALCNGLVANRSCKKMWEHFVVELVEGIHMH
jgi:hypothetical protein